MFGNFDPTLLDDPQFKEDAVREVLIAPMLTKLSTAHRPKSRYRHTDSRRYGDPRQIRHVAELLRCYVHRPSRCSDLDRSSSRHHAQQGHRDQSAHDRRREPELHDGCEHVKR